MKIGKFSYSLKKYIFESKYFATFYGVKTGDIQYFEAKVYATKVMEPTAIAIITFDHSRVTAGHVFSLNYL